jgi:hypothetical protein
MILYAILIEIDVEWTHLAQNRDTVLWQAYVYIVMKLGGGGGPPTVGNFLSSFSRTLKCGISIMPHQIRVIHFVLVKPCGDFDGGLWKQSLQKFYI